MKDIITPVFTYGTILSHFFLVILFLALISYKSWGKDLIDFVGKRALLFGLTITTVSIIGSLTYSIFIGYTPCELCWWQRVFLFPQAVLFLIALFKKDNGVFKYVFVLSLIGGVISLYHSYIQLGGAKSILPCTANGGECTKVFVQEFRYITIPSMALTISLYVILLVFIRRFYERGSI